MGWIKSSQDARAGGAHEGADSHVGIGWAPLVAVKALSVGRQTRHFSKHLQVFLLLFSFRTRRHGKGYLAQIKRGDWL